MKNTITIEIDEKELENAKCENTEAEKIEENDSVYARRYDESCAAWNESSEYNLIFLRMYERYANDILRNKGYIFLNEVYEMMSMAKTKEGQVVGWVYDGKNPFIDNYVDFGIYRDCNKDFIAGKTNVALLDFNVDGVILNKI